MGAILAGGSEAASESESTQRVPIAAQIVGARNTREIRQRCARRPKGEPVGTHPCDGPPAITGFRIWKPRGKGRDATPEATIWATISRLRRRSAKL